MENSEPVRDLQRRLERLERRERLLIFLAAGAVAALIGTVLFGAPAGSAALAAQKSDSDKVVDSTALVLRAKGNAAQARLSVGKVDDNETHLDITDADGKLRARLAWLNKPERGQKRRPVASFALFDGAGRVVQRLPID